MKNTYNPLSSSIRKKLRQILGKRFLETQEDLRAYSVDASPHSFLPEAVALPESAEEIAQILRLAQKEKFPVIPRGAGTSTTGATLAVKGGLVISLLRLNRILEINREDLVAVVEPGVFTGDFKRAVEEVGLFYPPDPASYEFSTIGGNVACGAGGPKGLKYGTTKDYVLGLEVVTARGEIIFCGRRTMKGVVGYDLVHLFTGSEGTLGVITKLILKLIPKPPCQATLALWLEDTEKAAKAFLEILKAKLFPATAELLDDTTLLAVKRFLEKEILRAQALLLLEFDGAKKQVEEDLLQAQKILKNFGLKLEVATSKQEREKLWRARRLISPALKKIAPGKLADDVVLPRSKVPEFLSFAKNTGEKYGLTVACFGHLGDGNIHVNILFEKNDEIKAQKVRVEILNKVLDLCGTISGEHGIGLTKKGFLPKELSPEVLSLMKGIKQVFDPHNILNPEKIF
ncbi:FAD linked oxidase domain protein [Thermodesulfatator indicus DSM 15286]|uniref:FAD linked oxidase domain protein n=1 Tax=Thermodesulfatator indicus (strain DSM 15286 / JCM 11887 / CIR29812) TaxID=667014 RepID=F8A7X2_THEID|nr:FAD linked oxidase domain protein [Thermodesulfatator indicus DSM 15286]